MRHVDNLNPAALRTPLATASSLVALHARRAQLYEVIAALLDPLDDTTESIRLHAAFAEVTPFDGDYRCLEQLRVILSTVACTAVSGELEPLADDDCPAPNGLAGPARACRHRAEEARLIARLARGTADALWRDDLAGASSLFDVQVELLAGHTGECLTELGCALPESGVPITTRVAASLRCLVEDDRHLLAVPRQMDADRV